MNLFFFLIAVAELVGILIWLAGYLLLHPRQIRALRAAARRGRQDIGNAETHDI